MVARYVSELIAALERHGERPAIGTGAEVLRFHEVLDAVHRLAGALDDAGVRRGTGLACVTGGNRPEALLVRLAAHVLGARLTQVVGGPAVHGVEFILRDCRPGLVVHDVPVPETGAPRLGLDALLAAAAACEPAEVPVRAREEDLARVMYTGGTTGRPKGVASTFGALAARDTGRGARWTESVYLSVTTLAQRSGGRCLEQLRAGGRVEILDPFAPREFAAACRRLGRVSTYLTPPMLYRLLDDPATAQGIPGLEAVSYGASPVLPERLREAVTRWGVRWRQGYGMNEAAVICRLTPDDHDAAVAGRPELLASAGRPAVGVEIQVRDDRGAVLPAGRPGEVWVRSETVMSGYWNQPALTAEVLRGGWLRTGDVGHVDDGGYLYLDDRVKDIVIVNGANIYCLPVEASLARHPAVARAVVVGRPSPLTGEEVCAFLVPPPGCEPSGTAAAEACDLVERDLAPAHRPTAVFWEREIPLTARGKPDKRLLRRRAAGCPTAPPGGQAPPGPG
ncbi:class I adenylate-forming enzyme family protein [Streptomyces lavendulae]|uniref:class I adenylate-forming enzyme family protein n=1 Tax=Streptomyces lavendulae TaxID=1914 RepID=UPI0024A19B4D|nr:AMP-binding protein [Streptomyces lavendulae]GLX17455.1 fatty acid CoA ligase [Streptomyces lavendulae subsp. lavendulae]GLX24685.1 fatty acid CoA ligase [Streptomyces lavendulae subsp. lavendulae]